MTVTFGDKKGKKTPVYVDGAYIGALYPGELRQYDLEDEGEISEAALERVQKECLLLRAKRYVMNLLLKADKTEEELKRKLRENGYSEETSEGAIEYVRSFHYIDELRTAENYIRTKMFSSSEKEIRYKLSEKGINDETIDMAYDRIAEENEDEEKGNTELNAAESLLRKKLKTAPGEDLPYEEKQKLMSSAYRKGFRSETIREALENLLREGR